MSHSVAILGEAAWKPNAQRPSRRVVRSARGDQRQRHARGGPERPDLQPAATAGTRHQRRARLAGAARPDAGARNIVGVSIVVAAQAGDGTGSLAPWTCAVVRQQPRLRAGDARRRRGPVVREAAATVDAQLPARLAARTGPGLTASGPAIGSSSPAECRHDRRPDHDPALPGGRVASRWRSPRARQTTSASRPPARPRPSDHHGSSASPAAATGA